VIYMTSQCQTLLVNRLPHRLFLVSLWKDKLDFYTKILIKLAFFCDRKQHFFSYTETKDEVSLIVDDQSLDLLKSSTESIGSLLVIAPGKWKAIEVYEGAAAIM